MADDLNVFETAAWERDLGPARRTRVGAGAGARELGCSLYEVDPGGQATPYHAHCANEELLIVLDGVLELRTPEGTRAVSKGDGVLAARICRPMAGMAERVRASGRLVAIVVAVPLVSQIIGGVVLASAFLWAGRALKRRYSLTEPPPAP